MAKPFVKWAGGKSQIIDIIDEKIWSIRQNMDSFIYVEPFVGGGSVLFHLLETCSDMKYAVINDMNEPLMNVYRTIRDNDEYIKVKDFIYSLQDEYNKSEDKQSKYLENRTLYNLWLNHDIDMPDAWGSAMFIFLNKCGFNGLYRVNSNGAFNVPWGQKKHLYIFNEDALDKCHVALQKVVVMSGDYSKTDIFLDVANASNCGVIYYLDPPYKPVSNQSFVSYTKYSFDDRNQVQLKSFCDKINAKGGRFLLSNSKCGDYFDILYKGYGIETISAKRMINSIGTKRGDVEEVLICN